jgi:hypothetical protein
MNDYSPKIEERFLGGEPLAKDLATFNLFREPDKSIHVTIADASGVRDELNGSGAPLHLCALSALRAAEELRPAKPTVDFSPAGLLELTKAQSEGAFRMGAQAMRAAIEMRGNDLIERREARGRKQGNDYIVAALQFAAETPIPMFPPQSPAPEPAWQWFSGANDEWYSNGPFDTRDEAIEALEGEGGFIIEAQKQRVRFTASGLIDDQYYDADDLFSYDHGDEHDRIGGADLIAAADAELQALLDAWTARWQHTFAAPTIFAATRNAEQVATAVAEGAPPSIPPGPPDPPAPVPARCA